jgi:hypothetical protein
MGKITRFHSIAAQASIQALAALFHLFGKKWQVFSPRFVKECQISAQPFLYDGHKFKTHRGEKEYEMSTNRLLVVVIAVALAAVAALTIREGLATQAATSGYSEQRSPESITVVSTDYWARHPELRQPAAWRLDTARSGYFANHSPKSITSVSTDYWTRHPELRQLDTAGSGYFANHSPKSITSVSTDYWARHPELGVR